MPGQSEVEERHIRVLTGGPYRKIFEAMPAVETSSDYFGPTGFRWMVPGRLGGMPQPGLLRDPEHDLEALERINVTVLVTLTEAPLPCEDLCAAYGLETLFWSIPDMAAPSIGMADEICAAVDQRLQDGETVAFHCRAGKGRTGTLLASQLLWYEPDADTALDYVRTVNPAWVESRLQEEFLERFAAHRRIALKRG